MHWLFIDLGKRRDYAAIAAVEEVEIPYRGLRDGVLQRGAEAMVTTVYEVIGLEEEKGVPYPELARHAKTIMRKPELAGEQGIVVDTTGVGEAFCDMLRDPLIVAPGMAQFALFPLPITITGGHAVNVDERGYNVPKTDIVDTLVAVFQTERINLHTPEDMPLVARLREQIEHFTGSLTKRGNQTYGADDEQIHDDLVMCLAMGLWYTEYTKGFQATRPLHVPQSEPYDPRTWRPR